MLIAGIWGLVSPEPILSFLWRSVTEPAQNAAQWIIRLFGVAFIVGGGILLYRIQKLPSDITAKRIGQDAELIKKAIIEITQLYKSFVEDAKTYDTEDYFPLIKDDVIVKKDVKAFKDKGIATRSFLAHNPINPLLEKLKSASQEWKDLNDDIDRAAMDISDTRLNTYLRKYRNQLESSGTYKVKASAVLNTNPVTTYGHRQVVNLNQEFFDSSTEATRTELINYLDDLIIEYSEESEKVMSRELSK
ncbi:MAG: hypothetical protein ABSA18_13370 [Dehalococcoidia bacterium]